MLDWFGGEATLPELIQRKKYDKAERLLRKEFEAGRRDATLRLQLADVIALAGRGKEAVPIYIGLADEFARAGHAPKAIAILKKIEQALTRPRRGRATAWPRSSAIAERGRPRRPSSAARRWPLSSRRRCSSPRPRRAGRRRSSRSSISSCVAPTPPPPPISLPSSASTRRPRPPPRGPRRTLGAGPRVLEPAVRRLLARGPARGDAAASAS